MEEAHLFWPNFILVFWPFLPEFCLLKKYIIPEFFSLQRFILIFGLICPIIAHHLAKAVLPLRDKKQPRRPRSTSGVPSTHFLHQTACTSNVWRASLLGLAREGPGLRFSSHSSGFHQAIFIILEQVENKQQRPTACSCSKARTRGRCCVLPMSLHVGVHMNLAHVACGQMWGLHFWAMCISDGTHVGHVVVLCKLE